MNFEITAMHFTDWKQVKRIYNAGIATGLANFYEHAPSWKIWNGTYLEIGRLVARSHSGDVIGWAALSPVGGH